MNDPELWQYGTEQCRQLYRQMPPLVRKQLDKSLKELGQCKTQLMTLVSASGAAAICRQCGGECCLYGKYHVTLVDILAFCSTGTDIFSPDFSKHPACPYSGSEGCMMEPDLRPLTCIIFICELLEARLTPDMLDTLAELEQKLRRLTAEINAMTGRRLDRPLLLNAETDVPPKTH